MLSHTEWRAFCARVPVLQNRMQSLAFLTGEGIDPVPLRPGGRIIEQGSKRKISDWILTTVPAQQNWGALLKKPYVDVDYDTDPLRGVADAAYRAEAMHCIDLFEAHLKSCGIEYRQYGRASLGYRGHFIIPVPAVKTKALDEEAILKRLHMTKPCPSGNVLARIEVRGAAAKVGGKAFTLPGSVYMDGDEPDLIGWKILGTFKEGEAMPALPPQDVMKLRLAIYSAIMTLAVKDDWTQGARHEASLYATGVLAHEVMRDGLSEGEAAHILDQIVLATGDPSGEERDRMLSDSIHAVGTRPVYGYTAFGELFGEAWKDALLRLRGGSGDDPDALARLFELVVRIRYARRASDAYVDLSSGADAYVEHDANGMRTRFKYRTEFPKVPDRNGRMADAIELVLHSDRIRTYDRALTFPGVAFGTVFHFDDDAREWIETTDEDPAPERAKTGINVAPGFVTAIYTDADKPDVRDWRRAKQLWHRLRAHLTCNDPDANAKLDQLIARKLQLVREKYPVGCALVGGQGIGKSFLFEVVLSALIGDTLIKKSNTSEWKTNFSFNDIERVLFYYVEECRFEGLPTETLQLLKDLMRNKRIFRNVKKGTIGETTNLAVPFFLSNENNPKLMFDGRADRALIVIRGESQERLDHSLGEWTDHKRLIHAECEEFAKALRSPLIRRALLHYFMTLDLDPDLGADAEISESEELRRSLPPALEALIEMLETGWILPERRGDRGPTIMEPFTLGTLIVGVRERLKNRGVSTFLMSNQGIGNLITELFLENTKGNSRAQRSREQRSGKVLAATRLSYNGEATRMYYFAVQRGMLLQLLKEKRGIELEPEYELNGAEMGINPPPTKEAMLKAYAFATELSATNRWRGLGFDD